MNRTSYILIRPVDRAECPWLDRDFSRGERVYRFDGATYGCVSPSGMACSLDGETPFFELPRLALLDERLAA